jgi:hypothetical protein
MVFGGNEIEGVFDAGRFLADQGGNLGIDPRQMLHRNTFPHGTRL